MFNHSAYNLLLFCKEIEIWVDELNGYDNSKVDFHGFLDKPKCYSLNSFVIYYPHLNNSQIRDTEVLASCRASQVNPLESSRTITCKSLLTAIQTVYILQESCSIRGS